jgi:exodeoxyribonuclease V alpha subunit
LEVLSSFFLEDLIPRKKEFGMPLEAEFNLLKNFSERLDKAQEAAAATLLLSARKGLFCLKPDSIPFLQLFEEEEATPDLQKLIQDGFRRLSPFPHVIRGGAYFLPKMARYIESLSHTLSSLTALIEEPDVSLKGLSSSQENAVRLALKRRLSLIVGGPGTGKTYTAGVLISLLKRENFSIGCAAPTGKAADRLKENLQGIESRTLHSLLGVGRDPREALPLLPYDLLIVDEASMIDPHLFTLLLERIPKHGRLILLGDPDQLPPVDGGSFFSLLTDIYLKKGWTERLETSHRTENRNLLRFAEAIRIGDLQALEELLPLYLQETRPPPENSRILSPLRSEVDEINKKMFKRAFDQGERTIPVLLTKNSPRQGLWNGEIGHIELPPKSPIDFSLRSHPQAKAYFNGKEWSPTSLPPFDLAYALTIHKSQGTEENSVALLLPSKAPLTRASIYTAVTRAKKNLTLHGTKETFFKAIESVPPSHPKDIFLF